MVHRRGRDTILHGMGLALNSKYNSDQQLLSLADCRQYTTHTGLQHLFTGARKSSHGGHLLPSRPPPSGLWGLLYWMKGILSLFSLSPSWSSSSSPASLVSVLSLAICNSTEVTMMDGGCLPPRKGCDIFPITFPYCLFVLFVGRGPG